MVNLEHFSIFDKSMFNFPQISNRNSQDNRNDARVNRYNYNPYVQPYADFSVPLPYTGQSNITNLLPLQGTQRLQQYQVEINYSSIDSINLETFNAPQETLSTNQLFQPSQVFEDQLDYSLYNSNQSLLNYPDIQNQNQENQIDLFADYENEILLEQNRTLNPTYPQNEFLLRNEQTETFDNEVINYQITFDELQDHTNQNEFTVDMHLNDPHYSQSMLAQISSDLQEQCEQYEISISDYLEYKRQLISLNFTEIQANQMLLRKNSLNSVMYLLNKYMTLTTEPFNLNNDQLFKVSCYYNSKAILSFLLKYFDSFKELNFTMEQVLKIASNKGGHNNLSSILENFAYLKERNFTLDEMVSISKFGNAKSTVENLVLHYDYLINQGFSKTEIIGMAKFQGHKNIQVIVDNLETLKTLCSLQEIVSLASKSYGYRNILNVLKKAKEGEINNFSQQTDLLVIDPQQCSSRQREQCSKYKILIKDYLECKSLLIGKNFTETQIDKLFFREYSSRSINILLDMYDILVSEPYALNNNQIVTLLSYIDGDSNVEAFLENFEFFKAQGFSAEQIIKIASSRGGKNNVNAIVQHFETLKRYNFSIDEITKISGFRAGNKNIEALITHYDKLSHYEFTKEQIMIMVNRRGGDKTLLTVVNNIESLKSILSIEKIVSLAQNKGGYKVIIKFLADNCSTVQNEEQSNIRDNILVDNILIATQDIQGAQLVGAEVSGLCKHYNIDIQTYLENKLSLIDRNFSEVEIDKIILRPRPFDTVNCLIKNYNVLIADPYNLNNKQLTEISKFRGSYNNIQAIVNYLPLLKEKNFTLEQIVSIVKFKGGHHNIQAVAANYENLHNREFTNEQIFKIAKNISGKKNLGFVVQHYDNIHAHGFTNDQIVRIVSREKGYENLQSVINNIDALKNFMSLEDIVNMVSKQNGYKDIINFLTQNNIDIFNNIDVSNVFNEDEVANYNLSAEQNIETNPAIITSSNSSRKRTVNISEHSIFASTDIDTDSQSASKRTRGLDYNT